MAKGGDVYILASGPNGTLYFGAASGLRLRVWNDATISGVILGPAKREPGMTMEVSNRKRKADAAWKAGCQNPPARKDTQSIRISALPSRVKLSGKPG